MGDRRQNHKPGALSLRQAREEQRARVLAALWALCGQFSTPELRSFLDYLKERSTGTPPSSAGLSAVVRRGELLVMEPGLLLEDHQKGPKR